MADNHRTVVVELTDVICRKDNGFCIIKTIVREAPANPAGVGRKLTCIGNMPELVIGAYYRLEGEAVKSEKFNEVQLHFRKWKLEQTASVTGLQNYLAKECPHIGDGRADQIVKSFGEESLKILQENPERVAAEIAGVNLSTAIRIQDWAKQDAELSSVKKRLYEANLTTGLIKKLLQNHGAGIEQVLKEKCFSLTEIRGIGFLTADRLGKKFGLPNNDPMRLEQGITYALKEVMEDKGHTCIQQHELVIAACKLLEVDKRFVVEAIKKMLADKLLCTQHSNPAEFSKYPELFVPLAPPDTKDGTHEV